MILYLDDSGLLKRNGENRWDSFFVFPYVVMTGRLPRMTMIFTPFDVNLPQAEVDEIGYSCQRLERNDGFDVENYFKGDRFELCSISAYLIWYHRSHTYLISIISTCIISYGIYHIYTTYPHSLHEWTQLDAWTEGTCMSSFCFLGNRYSNSRCRKERFESLWDAEHVPVHPGNWCGVWSDPSKRMSNGSRRVAFWRRTTGWPLDVCCGFCSDLWMEESQSPNILEHSILKYLPWINVLRFVISVTVNPGIYIIYVL